MKKELVLYITTNCPVCRQVEKILDKGHVPYKTLNLDDASVYAEAVTSGLTVMSAPVLVIGRRTIYKAGLLHRDDLHGNLKQIVWEELGIEIE